jgi:hypothetical protein
MPSVVIQGLVKPDDTILATADPSNPSIVTDAPFIISGAGAVAQTCSAIKSAASSTATSDAFLATYALSGLTSIKNKLSSLKTNLGNFKQDITISDKTGFTDVNSFITSLSTTYVPVINLVNTCLQESLQVDTVSLTKAQKTLEESKARLESITNPEQNVSYYEGWFPIVRPMTEAALFGLFAAAIFMLLLSILVFLRLSGVQIDIQIPEMAFSLPPNASYYMYGGVAAGIIGGIGYAYYLRR